MKIYADKNKKSIVTEVDNWPHPKKDKQWKPGRSAMELAKFVLSGTRFQELINIVLTECNVNHDMNFKCYPEYKTSFGKGMGNGGPRVHDMLMKGCELVIGVEAKVLESFDEKMRIKKGQQGRDKQGKTRADKLAKILDGKRKINYEDIGYQLFSATYGTMKEAYDCGKDKCVMLVLVFKGNVCEENNYHKKCEENENDFNLFCKFVDVQKGLIEREINDRTIRCWIKKVEVNIDTEYIIES